MVEWDARGLPPAAQRRIDSIGTTHLRSSLLSVSGTASLESTGFRPISEVMGAIVLNTAGATMPSCGIYNQGYGFGANPMYANSRTMTNAPGSAMGGIGYTSYVEVINSGWSTALSRMMLETTKLQADGVVDIRLQQNPLGSGAVEFVALGTAVGARHEISAHKPFSTHLSGSEVSKLLHHGYVPASILIEVSVAIRHDDIATYNQASMWAQNTEITGYSDLVHTARSNARDRLSHAVTRVGAQGAIVDSLSLRVFEYEPYENHRDHVAEVTVIGTSIVSFAKGVIKAMPLSILSLKDNRK